MTHRGHQDWHPRQQDPATRRHHHGAIRPMIEPSWFERLIARFL